VGGSSLKKEVNFWEISVGAKPEFFETGMTICVFTKYRQKTTGK
jgi:hypothetical protein